VETLKKILLIGLGVTFILSTILKTISVYSFSQTVNSFCGLLGMDVLYGYGFPLAIVIITFELLIGVNAFIRPLREIAIWIYPLILRIFTYISFINITLGHTLIYNLGGDVEGQYTSTYVTVQRCEIKSQSF